MANCAFLKNGKERWLWKKITKKEEKKRRKKVSAGDRSARGVEDHESRRWRGVRVGKQRQSKQCFLRVRFLETAPYSRTATHHAIPHTIYGGEQAHA